ncbi:MAG: MazG nucleotide pyrophosphohydrolase domain-containing protein [Phycisphaerales bacterium]|jgi:NTP pyrophosphatase (non-canonical NTP hydrolase)|nr:MazG nucleotide pyrophosphohydrolase domain-containing protein [Phycisphaerales bacterium]MDP6693800.1 MazG nucleotide pyrophosphohydrolase domain-containing protein [Phycisphaerales bacterium]
MAENLTIEDFQALIKERYFPTDSARGIAKTYLWLAEEQGELAKALGKYESGERDMQNLAEEFADVLAWLATLANITEIDLSQAIYDKYISNGGPQGTK